MATSPDDGDLEVSGRSSPHHHLSVTINHVLHLLFGPQLEKDKRHALSIKLAHLVIASIVVLVVIFVGGAVLQHLERPLFIGQTSDYNAALALIHDRLNSTEFALVYRGFNLKQIQSLYGNDKMTLGDGVWLMLLYATAIGSGDYSSKSTAGNVFLMLYGTVAIVFVTYATFVIAEIVFAAILWAINTIARRDVTQRKRVKASVLVAVLIILICVGGVIFKATNPTLSYVNAMYYSWSILATFGLGDISADGWVAKTIVSIYSLVGVGLWASAVQFAMSMMMKTTALPDDKNDSEEQDEDGKPVKPQKQQSKSDEEASVSHTSVDVG